MKKNVFIRAISLFITFLMIAGTTPLSAFAADAAAPGFTQTEFHMTDSDWTVGDSGYASEINRHPSVYVSWQTAGLDAPDGTFAYTAELYVYSGPAYRVRSNLEFLADKSGWAADDPRANCIYGLGNNYWRADVSSGIVTADGGCFNGVLDGVYKYDVTNACIQQGDDCCWQLLIYRASSSDSELVLYSPITDATVEYMAGMPYMTAAPAGGYAALYSESGYSWADSLKLEPDEDTEYEAEFYVWPAQGLDDPYNFEYGWINTLPWSDDFDVNVLTSNGTWAEDLYWFDNTSSMDEITAAPGMKVTMGVEIYKIDRSGGGFKYSLYRRLPVVEFITEDGSTVTADQPSINTNTATYDSNNISDIQITKYDGDFTFDCLKNGAAVLTPGTDYTVAGNTVTVKKEYIASLGAGTSTLTFHYTGEVDGVSPVDPTLSLTVRQMCTPVLSVTGYQGADITADCDVKWYNSYGNRVYEPISVSSGTTLSYEITPKDALKINGVQYYGSYSDEVTLTEAEQTVTAALPQRGTVTAVPVSNSGEALPNNGEAGYEIDWYGYPEATRAAGGGSYLSWIGSGDTSPLRNSGGVVYVTITLTGKNAELYSGGVTEYPVNVTFGNHEEQISFTQNETVSPVLTVTGYNGADVTDKCTVVWRDANYNTLTEPFPVVAGSTVYYTVTPTDALMIGGVQYYTEVSGSVRLSVEDQPVRVELGQTGCVTLQLTDKKTGAVIPLTDAENNQNWAVTWYGQSGYRIGSEQTAPLRDAGEELSCYISLYSSELYENYYTPDTQYFTVGFGPKTVTVELERKVPELSVYEYERRISYNNIMEVRWDHNGYTFESVLYNGEPVEYDRNYSYESGHITFWPQYLASLGVGTHVFTIHYAETTDEDKYDTTLTMTQTKGDISEVRWRASYRSSGSYFNNETYTGEPITKKPILYVGSWANDKREGMLYEGVDYTVSYENNVNVSTDENKAKMIFTGIGEYEGSERTLEFTIQPLSITNSSDCYLEVIPNFDWPIVYDGEEKDLLDVTVKANGKTLVKDVDYTVEYDMDYWKDAAKAAVGENSLPVGSPDTTIDYPIIVKGIGNYSSAFRSRTASYGDEVRYRIMPRVAETVVGEEVEGWTWQLDPDGLLTINGEGNMPKGFSSAYWVGGSDPDHYYKYGWRYDYAAMIKRVVITDNVTSIEENAFWDCTNLVEATIPDTVVTINGMAFDNCRALKTVHAPGTKYLPQSLRTINAKAFGINTYNLSIWLPDNVTGIGVSNVPSSRKLYVKMGTVTHETLKALGSGGLHIVEGYDDFVLEYADNYGLGGTYTVYGYVGKGGETVLPDFVDSISVYDVFGSSSERITKLTIPGSIRILHGDAFRSMSRCAEVIIEPGEMDTLIRGLLNYHGDTVLTIPDTVTTMPGGDFTYCYDNVLLIVNEGSAALEWAQKNGYIPDDGTGIGRMYRVVKNVQPYVRPSNINVARGGTDDIAITKSDGEFTFASVSNGEHTLVNNADYTVSGNTVTIKASYLQTLDAGSYTLMFNYTGETDTGISPKNPKFLLNVIEKCYPQITVYGFENEDITDKCGVVWKVGNTVLQQPVSVLAGTTVTYTVTPGEELEADGVQYYVSYSGSVEVTEIDQLVEVTLGRRGRVTLTVKANGSPIPVNDGAGYNVTWYNANGSRIGTGYASPVLDEGTVVYYEAKMTGNNIEDYPDTERGQVAVGFADTAAELSVIPYEKCAANITVYGKNGADITDKCEIVWKKDGKVLPENFLVNKGTTITYTVTPGQELMIDGAQYYVGTSGSLTLAESAETVEVTLGRKGNVTVSVKTNGEALPENGGAGYYVTWYNENGYRISTGFTSPLLDDGTKIYYTVSMTGENYYDFPGVDRTEITVGLGNTTVNENVLPKNNVTLTVTGTKRGGEAVTTADFEIYWFTKNDDGTFKRIYLNSRSDENSIKFIDLSEYLGKDIYYEIAPKDHAGVYNWLQFKGIPLSGSSKIRVTNAPQSFAVELEAVKETVFSGNITNYNAVGADNVEFTFSQTPWSGYSTARSYYSYSAIWADMAQSAKLNANGAFSVSVCEFPLTVKITDKTGNYKTVYKAVAAEDLGTPVSITMEPEDLPGTLYIDIQRTYPYSGGGNKTSKLYLSSAELENEFRSMTFTLYNKTKGKVIDPSLYVIKADSLVFGDIMSLAGIIDTYDELTLSVALPEDAQAVITKSSDTLQITHNYYRYGEDISFDLAYTEFGCADIRTNAGWGTNDNFAIYGKDNALIASGRTNRYGYTTQRLDDGKYTVVVWRETNWITPAQTMDEMLSYFTGEYAGLYLSQQFEISKGSLSRVELGNTPEIKPRDLFTEDSGLSDEAINMNTDEWVLMKLHYEVDGIVAETHPGAMYEITVRTNIYAYYDPYVIPRYEGTHTYGVASKDKYISLYANGKLAESTVRIDLQDQYHLGSVHGFTLFTNEPEGDIYYYIQADTAGTYYSDAKGVMRMPDGTIDRSAKLGETKLNVTAASNSLSFASDYLRTEDNGNGYNIVWLYTTPNKRVTLYMDGVAIAENYSNYRGVATFNFSMNESHAGDAQRAEFAAVNPAWSVTGGHEMYAISENGVQSSTSYIECVKASDFKPALLTYLQVTSYTDYEDDHFNGSSLPLYELKYGRCKLYDQYYSVSDTGKVFSYRFTAWFEDGASVDSAYMVIGDQAGRQYIIPLERNSDYRSFSGMVSDERLLFTEWSIVIFSAGRAKLISNNTLDMDEIIYDPVEGDLVSMQTLYERLVDYADGLTDEEAAQIQKEEFDLWKELLYEITKEYYKNADDFDWDSLDGSPESIEALYAFFGYTIGTAADVDYESWEEGDYISETADDGRVVLYREYFTEEDGENYYNEYIVILPTDEDPDGWSQTHRVDLGPADTSYPKYYNADPASATRSTKTAQPAAKPKNFSSGINISGAANQIARAHQKVTGKSQQVNYSNLALQKALLRNQYGTGSNNSRNINQLGLMNGLDQITLQDFGDNHSEAGEHLINAYNGLNEAMKQNGYNNLESAINNILNNLEKSSEKEGKKINASGLLKTFADSQNGDWDARMNYVFGEYGGEYIGETYGYSSETYENYLKARELLKALGELQNGLRGFNKDFNLFNVKDINKLLNGNGGGGGNPKPIHDPQGVIYEAVLSNTVEGAVATLWERGADGAETEWNAEEYGQINPQTTDASGMFQWFVPEGEWQVRVTAPDGYSDNTSASHPAANLDDGSTEGWLPVMPVQLGINIPLVRNEAPAVENVVIYETHAEITFSLYMDIATLTNKTVTLSDGTNTLPCTIVFPDAEADPADESKTYARTMCLFTENGFDVNGKYSISVKADAAAYNSKTLQKYESGELPVSAAGEAKTYTVTFTDHDDTVLSEKTYHYGETPELPSEPSRKADEIYEYTFKTWAPDVSAVNGDAVYKAVYTAAFVNYTVKFVDSDGTLISEKTYHYGDMVNIPAVQAKEDDNYVYTFSGWDKKVTAVKGSASYTAVYDKTEKASEGKPGDLNGDGIVNNKDVVVLFRYVSGRNKVEDERVYDIDGDGEVNNKDVVELFRSVSTLR